MPLTLTTAVSVGRSAAPVIEPERLADKAWIEAGRYEIDLAGERFAAQVGLRAPYDPDGARVKS